MNFRLLGHGCPYGAYPAPVIPIGKTDGSWVAVYAGGNAGPTLEPIEKDAGFVRYDPVLRKKLANFDLHSHRLFAYSPSEVVMYEAKDEKEFLGKVLEHQKFSGRSVPIRNMLRNYLSGSSVRNSAAGARPVPTQQRLRRVG